jgi:translation initiation factor IF-3
MAQTVLLIGEDGKKIGNISFEEAKKIAKNQGKDLMLMNRDKRVYKIGDEGKLKYEKKRREKRARAQRRLQKLKEIQMRPTIEDSDLEVKLRHVREFLNEGLKTKLVMKFKRQQMSYKDTGMRKISGIIEKLVEEGLAAVPAKPKFEGRNIIVFLIPSKQA